MKRRANGDAGDARASKSPRIQDSSDTSNHSRRERTRARIRSRDLEDRQRRSSNGRSRPESAASRSRRARDGDGDDSDVVQTKEQGQHNRLSREASQGRQPAAKKTSPSRMTSSDEHVKEFVCHIGMAIQLRAAISSERSRLPKRVEGSHLPVEPDYQALLESPGALLRHKLRFLEDDMRTRLFVASEIAAKHSFGEHTRGQFLPAKVFELLQAFQVQRAKTKELEQRTNAERDAIQSSKVEWETASRNRALERYQRMLRGSVADVASNGEPQAAVAQTYGGYSAARELWLKTRAATLRQYEKETEDCERALTVADQAFLDRAEIAKPPLITQDLPEEERQSRSSGQASQRRRQTSEVSETPPPAREYLQEKSGEKLSDLARAGRALQYAEANLIRVRDDYSEKLSDFNDDVQHGLIRGTRTVFDQNYYLEQQGATHRVAEAGANYDRLLRDARAMGALEEEERSEGFRDRADDGYALSAMRRYVEKRLDRSRIERWRRRLPKPLNPGTAAAAAVEDHGQNSDEAQDDTTSSEASCVEALRPIDFASPSTFSQRPYCRAQGSRKQRIERWQKQQERVRRDALIEWAEKRRKAGVDL